MARKKFQQLPRRRRINILKRAQNAHLSKQQIQKKYNKKVRKFNKNQRSNRKALRPQTSSGAGVLKPGKKSSGISDVFKRGTSGGFHPPMSGSPEVTPRTKPPHTPDPNPLKPAKPTIPGVVPPAAVAEPPSTKTLVGDLVGEGTYGIDQSMNTFDFERFLSRIPQENYEDQQMQDPKFTGVRTDISGSSAGGVRRRRSKRSQLGINAMGTGQLKRKPRYKLTLGGLNI